jgi:Tol biopolymer transport system component
MKFLLLTTALIAGLALLAIAAPLDHLHGQPGPDYRLVFTPPRGSSADLVTSWQDGSHPTRLDLASPTESIHAFTWSPDGQWLVYMLQAANLNELHRTPPDRAAPQRLIRTVSYTTQTSKWFITAPDRRAAVAIERLGPRSTLIHLSADLGKTRRLIDPLDGSVRDVFWSPDSRYVYYRIYDSLSQAFATYRVPASGGRPQKITDIDLHSPVWSPDGRYLAYINGTGTITPTLEIRRADGRLVLQEDADPQIILHAWTKDGWLIGYTRDNRRLWRISASSGASAPISHEELEQFFAGLAPDGRHIFYITTEVAINGWTLHRLDPTTRQTVVLAQGQRFAGPHLLPDGSGAVFALITDRTVEFYRVNAAGSDPQLLSRLPPKESGYHTVEIHPSPDSQSVYVLTDWAYEADRLQPRRIHLRDGKIEALPPGYLANPTGWALPDWSGDGLLLVGAVVLVGALLILLAGVIIGSAAFLRKSFIDKTISLSDN